MHGALPIEVVRARSARGASLKARTHQIAQHVLEVSHNVGWVIRIWATSVTAAGTSSRDGGGTEGLTDEDRARRPACDVLLYVCLFRIGHILIAPGVVVEEVVIS